MLCALHRIENPIDKCDRHLSVKQIPHPVHKNHSWTPPTRGLRQSGLHAASSRNRARTGARDTAEPLCETLGVTVIAPRPNLRASSDRIPGRIGPFDRAVVRHPRPPKPKIRSKPTPEWAMQLTGQPRSSPPSRGKGRRGSRSTAPSVHVPIRSSGERCNALGFSRKHRTPHNSRCSTIAAASGRKRSTSPGTRSCGHSFRALRRPCSTSNTRSSRGMHRSLSSMTVMLPGRTIIEQGAFRRSAT